MIAIPYMTEAEGDFEVLHYYLNTNNFVQRKRRADMNQSHSFLLALALSFILPGCGGGQVVSLNPHPPGLIPQGGGVSFTDEEYKSLHNKVASYTATSAALAVAAGGSGGVTAVFDSSTPRYITGGTSLGIGIAAAVFGVLQKFASDDFSQGCKINR